MNGGLFQSEKQLRDAQFAADAAGGTGAGGGIFSQIGGSLGRALSGQTDPRITFARQMADAPEGALNDPTQLPVLAQQALDLGLPEEAFALMDRLSKFTPKAKKPEFVTINGQLVEKPTESGGEARLAGDFRDTEITDDFISYDRTLPNGQVQRIKVNRATGEEELVVQGSALSKDGSTGGGSKGVQRYHGFEPKDIAATLPSTKGFGGLSEEENMSIAVPVSRGISDLVNIGHGLNETQSADLLINEIGKVGIESGLFTDDVRQERVNAAAIKVMETERTISQWLQKAKDSGIKADRKSVLQNLIKQGKVDKFYGKPADATDEK